VSRTKSSERLVHATCVAIEGRGVLLRGPSGSGKSDLALRLIDEGAKLVADDQVRIARAGARLIARAPATIAGRMEVRGIGIVPLAASRAAPVTLVVDLVPRARIERMPRPASWACLGLRIPKIRLDPFDASAPAKLRLAVRSRARDSFGP
jgi:serine kinase of HPr protein (carbohydrate metabolism regulator)